MRFLKKILILLLIFNLWNFYLPPLSFPQVGFIDPEITKHPPEMRASPEQNIPVEKVEEKRTSWIWVVLGVILVGAVVAAAAGGGGGGGGSSSSSSGNTGSVNVGW